MSVTELLSDVSARGLTMVSAGGDLRLHGPTSQMDADLVARIRAAKPDLIAHFASHERHESIPLTPLQSGYLSGRGELAELGNVASHVYHEIEGVWDVERLERALQSVVDRYPALRASFTVDGRQIVHEQVRAHIRVRDLRALPEQARRESRAAFRQRASHRMLAVERPPLVRAEVSVLADDQMVLHVSHDGLVMDGISMFLFFRAWWQAYSGEQVDARELPFGEYVAELERAWDGRPAQRSRRYWLDRLDDLAPIPDLPLAVSPATITRPRFTQRQVRLDADAWAGLKQRATACDLTPTAVLLSAYAQTLACWGAGDRFTLNTTIANRPPIHPRIFDAVGQFSDTMLVEVDVEAGASFEQQARALQARLRLSIENRHFSGVQVLRELGRRGEAARARAPYTFNCAIGYVQDDVDGSTPELFGRETYSLSQTPQVWLNVFAMEQHGSLLVQLDGVDELFPDGLLDALVAGYQRLLELLCTETAWSAPVPALLPPQQRQRRNAANQTAAPRHDQPLAEAIVQRAGRQPDAAAVIFGGTVLSYADLHRRASRVATWLRHRQVGRDELVGLVMSRGPEQIVAILATAMAGAAYLPIDAGLPAQRRLHLLRDGRVRCVLTNAGETNLWGPDGVPDGLDVLPVSLDVEDHDPPDQLAPLPGAGVDDLAYVLYTSGTTGGPKGVMVSQRSVANVVADCNARFGVDPTDRFFGISAFNFDLSAYDVFGALTAGAAIVLPDPDRALDPAHWLDLCESAGVTVWNSVPAIVGLLHDQAEARPERLACLRLVMMSGDRIPPTLPSLLLRSNPELEIISLGGPTETTIWNILHPIETSDDGGRAIPYGRPNSNNRGYILDAAGRDTPDWVPGEICAAGVGLARGYGGDPARTDERFRVDLRRGERHYYTGDLGRYLPDGSIEILGRSDFQIKVNGYRIEAGEVETRLVEMASVRQAVVVRQESAQGHRLVAHLVADGTRPGMSAIRTSLAVELPDYMIPSAVVWHGALPLTGNGKVDRAGLSRLSVATSGRALPSASPSSSSVSSSSVSSSSATAMTAADRALTEVAEWLALIWAQILRVPKVAPDDSFFDLGGDSLAAARVLTEVRKRYRVSIPLEQLYEVRTVRTMAARIADAPHLSTDASAATSKPIGVRG